MTSFLPAVLPSSTIVLEKLRLHLGPPGKSMVIWLGSTSDDLGNRHDPCKKGMGCRAPKQQWLHRWLWMSQGLVAHISWLVLKATFLVLQDLLMHLMFQVIGRHSRKLCDLVLKMRICCIQKGLTLHAYQASSRRTLHHLQLIATTDSSTPVPSGVGYSSSVLFSLPLVGVNAQLWIFSWRHDPQAREIDRLAQQWHTLRLYTCHLCFALPS